MKNKIETYIIILIIVLCGIILQKKYINEFPSHIHAWAQSDRYALAMGFIKNNSDFFHPQTYVLNHQFPGTYKVPSKNSITSVDFPIHDYIPSLVMRLFHTTSPWCFRLYVLLYSCMGLFFLYKICVLLNLSIIKSSLLIIFAATSPVYVYYQAGFLPTIPSLANGIIGLYFYLSHTCENKKSAFYWGILFLTLAALGRTPFAIILLAVISLEFICFVKSKKYDQTKLCALFISITLIVSYFIYNLYLRSKYGSMFLNHPIPPHNITEVKEIIIATLKNWTFHYFSIIHYFLFGGLLFLSIYYLVVKKAKLSGIQRQTFAISLIILAGCTVYSFLMLKQFVNHDYYFLDTFYLPILVLFAVFLSIIPTSGIKYANTVTNLLVPITSCILILNAINMQSKRRESGFWDATEQTIHNFEDSKAFINSLKIPKNAKILDLCTFAPNIPFILMDRQGYATLISSEDNIKRALTWDYDYITIQNEFLITEVYANYPDIINKIEKVGDNGKISVFKYAESIARKSLIEFLGINNKIPIMEREITFDTIAGEEWQNTKSTTVEKHSGTTSGIITSKDDFGITWKTKNIAQLKNKSTLLYLTAFFLESTEPIKDCYIVTSINTPEGTVYYKSYDLANLLKAGKSWVQIDLTFQLPQMHKSDYEVGVYIWNNGHNTLYYDDFKIRLY